MTAVVLAVVGLLGTALFSLLSRLDRLGERIDAKFDRVDQRFEQVDQRFDAGRPAVRAGGPPVRAGGRPLRRPGAADADGQGRAAGADGRAGRAGHPAGGELSRSPRGQADFSRRSRFGVSRGTSVGLTCSRTTSRVTTTRATSSRDGTSYITWSRTSSMMARRPRAPVPRRIAWSAIASRASSVNSSSTPSSSKSRWYCLTSALLRLGEDRGRAPRWSSVAHAGDDREPADELGDQAELQQVLGHAPRRRRRRRRARPWRASVGGEAELFLPTRCSMILLEPGEGATDDEQDVGGVDLDELLVRVLAPTLRRHRGGGALEDLQQRLLDALAGDVAGDRRVLALAGDLVDLVDVDDPGLGLLDVVVGGLDQLEQDVLDVLADVAGLGERGGVGDRERHVEHPGQGLGEVGLAAAGRADAAGCWTWRARRRRPGSACRSRRPGPACSGCRRRPRAPSWRRPGR